MVLCTVRKGEAVILGWVQRRGGICRWVFLDRSIVDERREADRSCLLSDVDNAVAEANGHDGTGGRGANGDITKALKEEHARGL